MVTTSLRTAASGGKRSPSTRPLRRSDLPMVESGFIIFNPELEHILQGRCISSQREGIDGDRFPTVIVTVDSTLSREEQRRLFCRAVAERRRSRVANDSAGSAVAYLAAYRARRAGGAS